MSETGISCGSQIVLCDLPIRFDTYSGCSHDCKYCFARKKTELGEIRAGSSIKALKAFISGSRTRETAWCDWDIPLHWGGMSDPFQPAEKTHGASMEALKVFADSGYPFVVSTKGRLVAADPYVDVLRRCNAVVQVSAACPRYDRIERGAPPFLERMRMVQSVAPHVRRVIIRIQPYMIEAHTEIVKSLEAMKQSGAYGVIVEGIKLAKGHPGFVRVGGDYCYPLDQLKPRVEEIREKAHALGLAFFCGENRLRTMGDDMCCCGISGLKDFKGTRYNLAHLYNGDMSAPTPAMLKTGSTECFKAAFQSTCGSRMCNSNSFAQIMQSKTLFDAYKGVILGIGEVPAHTIDETLTFTRWLKSTGITAAEVNKYTGTQMSSHYLCTKKDGQCEVPTPEQFEKLRKCPKIVSVPSDIAAIVGEPSCDQKKVDRIYAAIKNKMLQYAGSECKGQGER